MYHEEYWNRIKPTFNNTILLFLFVLFTNKQNQWWHLNIKQEIYSLFNVFYHFKSLFILSITLKQFIQTNIYILLRSIMKWILWNGFSRIKWNGFFALYISIFTVMAGHLIAIGNKFIFVFNFSNFLLVKYLRHKKCNMKKTNFIKYKINATQ